MFARLSKLLFLASLTVFVACGDDSPTTTDDAPEIARTAIGDGDIGGGPFFMTAEGPAGSGLTFTLRGENLRYENDRLTAEFYAVNDGARPVRLPAVLTLVTIDPDSAGVDGADNGETGAGASFDLDFAEDDLEWSIGEASLAETLAFDVAQGVSIAFVARIDVDMDPLGGSIGGSVFEDLDEDGVFDSEENGVGGVGIEVTGGDTVQRMRTMRDGTYRFDGLDAGPYTVTQLPSRRIDPTGATSIQVLLAENEEGEVGDYLNASFGVLVLADPPVRPPLAEGDFVEVTGRYRDGVLVAHEIERERDEHGAELRGPVTDVDVEGEMLAIMGVALDVGGLHLEGGGGDDICRDGSALDLMIGDRARARIFGMIDDEPDTNATATEDLYGVDRMKCWSGDKEKVYGAVEGIVRDDDDRITGFTVVGLEVVVNGRTEFEHDRDDDHDDDDDEDDDRS